MATVTLFIVFIDDVQSSRRPTQIGPRMVVDNNSNDRRLVHFMVTLVSGWIIVTL